jgi:hypothetical protein
MKRPDPDIAHRADRWNYRKSQLFSGYVSKFYSGDVSEIQAIRSPPLSYSE